MLIPAAGGGARWTAASEGGSGQISGGGGDRPRLRRPHQRDSFDQIYGGRAVRADPTADCRSMVVHTVSSVGRVINAIVRPSSQHITPLNTVPTDCPNVLVCQSSLSILPVCSLESAAG